MLERKVLKDWSVRMWQNQDGCGTGKKQHPSRQSRQTNARPSFWTGIGLQGCGSVGTDAELEEKQHPSRQSRQTNARPSFWTGIGLLRCGSVRTDAELE